MSNSVRWLENITIHGVRYIFTGHGSKFTKLFWTIAILVSLAGFCYNNYKLYMKLYETPDINVRVRQKFLSKIPFPAITVCTSLFATNRLASYYNASRQLRLRPGSSLNLTIQEQNFLASNIHACSPGAGFSLSPHTNQRTNNNIVKLLNESFMLTSETILNCNYKDSTIDCLKLFNRVLTDRGFCYTFNLMGYNTIFNEHVISEDFDCYKRSNITKSMYRKNSLSNDRIDDNNEIFKWSLDNGYSKDHEADSVPVKAENGKIFYFCPFLKESDVSNVCMIIGNVFSIFIHLPIEIMLPSHQEYYVEFRKKLDVLLTAKSYRADDGLRRFEPKSRGCYFEDEKQLKFFKSYTKSLCEFECMTNYTLMVCGCVKFSMPRNSSTPVCKIEQSICYHQAMKNWPDYEKFNDRFEATCGCLKTCNDIKYDIKFQKTSTGENTMLIFETHNFSKGDIVSRISFMFDDFEVLEYEEYAVYSLHNFVADIGGLLGFFLGCSILSLIEIAYFTLETCINRINYYFVAHGRNRKHNNSIQSIKVDRGLDFVIRSSNANNQVLMVPSRFDKNTSIKSLY